MAVDVEQIVGQIHNAPTQAVLATAGGGSRALAQLLTAAGASRTVLEASVPYSESALVAYLGGRPDQLCSAETARAMAVVAFQRACRYAEVHQRKVLVGLACSASLATDRQRRGTHRAHLALQNLAQTTSWAVELHKGRRSRAEEEQLVARALLNVMAEASGLEDRLELTLLAGEQLQRRHAVASPAWQDLLLGQLDSLCHSGAAETEAIFPGAFNPLHAGHRRMAEIAERLLGVPVSMEISVINVDKPPLDYVGLEERTDQFDAQRTLWLTRAATFEKKSQLFPGVTFIVGTDTLRRIADPHYHAGSPSAHGDALRQIAENRCSFLVFGRDMGTGFVRLSDLELPQVLRSICREVPQEQFHEDVSSTRLRRADS